MHFYFVCIHITLYDHVTINVLLPTMLNKFYNFCFMKELACSTMYMYMYSEAAVFYAVAFNILYM